MIRAARAITGKNRRHAGTPICAARGSTSEMGHGAVFWGAKAREQIVVWGRSTPRGQRARFEGVPAAARV